MGIMGIMGVSEVDLRANALSTGRAALAVGDTCRHAEPGDDAKAVPLLKVSRDDEPIDSEPIDSEPIDENLMDDGLLEENLTDEQPLDESLTDDSFVDQDRIADERIADELSDADESSAKRAAKRSSKRAAGKSTRQSAKSATKSASAPRVVRLPRFFAQLGLDDDQQQDLRRTIAQYEPRIRELEDRLRTLNDELDASLMQRLSRSQQRELKLRRAASRQRRSEPKASSKSKATTDIRRNANRR